jgi:hypothetical protein
LTRKERKRLESIKRRRYNVLQAVDKEGGIAVIEKQWYKEKM